MTNQNEAQPNENEVELKEDTGSTDIPNILTNQEFSNIQGFIDVLSSDPTFTPRNFFDSLKIFSNKLYFYDHKNNAWQNSSGYQIKMGYAEKSTSGNSIISIGFKPTYFIMVAWVEGNNMPFSIGYAIDSENENPARCWMLQHYCSNSTSKDWANDSDANATYIAYLSKDGADLSKATITQWGAPGVTVNWTVSTGTAKFFYIAIK